MSGQSWRYSPSLFHNGKLFQKEVLGVAEKPVCVVLGILNKHRAGFRECNRLSRLSENLQKKIFDYVSAGEMPRMAPAQIDGKGRGVQIARGFLADLH